VGSVVTGLLIGPSIQFWLRRTRVAAIEVSTATGNRLVRATAITTVGCMVVVIAHEPSSLYLGEGFVLVERDLALEFDDVFSAQSLLNRYASEPCFVAEDLAQHAA